MRIVFKKLHIHHFLSFDDATIDLTNKGYCLVSGVNKNPRDAAKSNGSGKSTIWNAISFVLTGETISGLRSNLSNIYFDDGCYCDLEFNVDNNEYKLIRSRDDDTLGTNLKIYINGEDKSGKGIRESEALLEQYLPDLTRELIGSVIIIGQGMPVKFTSNSPSGRKEVLEHLSKSDFMIQDLKTRIENRLSSMNTLERNLEDDDLKTNTQMDLYSGQLTTAEKDKETYNQDVDFDTLITKAKSKLEEVSKNIQEYNSDIKIINEKKEQLNKDLISESNIKQARLEKIHSEYTSYDSELKDKKNNLSLEYNSLDKEIKTLKSITDICPTCGQKIPNITKPNTSEKEKQLIQLKESLDKIVKDIIDNDSAYIEAKKQVDELFNQSKKSLDEDISVNNKELSELSDKQKLSLAEYTKVAAEVADLEKQKEIHESKLMEILNKIKELQGLLDALKVEKSNITTKLTDTRMRLDILSKMNTAVKRDFRGILLQSIINYIDKKAKYYSSKIFGSDEIEFKLDGNNIDITFCSKDYENLSGGEKQRVDLITQFAIRDMMSNRLNFSSNILVLDEITDALDPISCDKVINFITSELSDIESVFIISHHAAELDIPADSEIVVEKDACGVSRIM